MVSGPKSTEEGQIPLVDTNVPHQARVYDYWLGGKDNFTVDRATGDLALEANPDIIMGVRANRDFLIRAVRYLAGEAGIRQFLDIGTGIPTANNTHEVAQAVAPDSRVVYVDKDPIVLAHARALLTSTEQGTCAYLDADANDPDTILMLAEHTLDFSQPVAVTMLAILQVLRDPYAVVERLMQAVPSGSYLAISIPASDIDAERQAAAAVHLAAGSPGVTLTFRSRPEVERFFAGLELVEPGVTTANRWRPLPETPDRELPAYVAVGRKP
ncbi:SAM-dependent methyltransferase [Trebonia sp.]|uniref:SAM-dependent methyltransferase n=1 Tax=Trebonia sp. TaxID=2767075 RepID=UPI002604AD4A|nr:SAM-dependent methyltransferase [Trebonia sp.]